LRVGRHKAESVQYSELFGVRLSNKNIRQSASLPTLISFGRARSRTLNKTSCIFCIYTIRIRVRVTVKLANLPSHW